MNKWIGEEWRDIKGYEGYYKISNKGRVKSFVGWDGRKYVHREKLLKPYIEETGNNYSRLVIGLNKKKKREEFKVHQLVARAFIPNPKNRKEINHIDGNPFNNKVENLEWCTHGENMIHAIKTGLKAIIYIPKSELVNLYVKQGKTQAEIADIYNVSTTVVRSRLEKYGIRIKSTGESRIKYNLTKDFISEQLKIKSQSQLAKEIGCDQSLISHYKKRIDERGEIYA